MVIEVCIGGEGYQYPVSLEVNGKLSHIPLSKLENIPIIKFPKYPISLIVNKNIPEITNTSTVIFCQVPSCNSLCSINAQTNCY